MVTLSAIDPYFDSMKGYCLAQPATENRTPETKLFQMIVLKELLTKEETPKQFIGWLHTKHGKKMCELADLNPSFLEKMALKLEKKWHLIPQKCTSEMLNVLLAYQGAEN